MRPSVPWSLVVIMTLTIRASAETIEFNGHTYELFGLGNGTTLSWTAAYLDATNRTKHGQQGYLARIESSAELSAIAGLISPFGSAWIGLTDNPTYGGTESKGQANPAVDGWVWADFNIGTKPFAQTVAASPIMQFAWSPNQPDNDAPFNNAHYVQLTSSGTFVDEDNWANNYVIEYDAVGVPEPHSGLIASITVAACLSLRRLDRRRRSRQPSSEAPARRPGLQGRGAEQ